MLEALVELPSVGMPPVDGRTAAVVAAAVGDGVAAAWTQTLPFVMVGLRSAPRLVLELAPVPLIDTVRSLHVPAARPAWQ